MKEGNEGLTSYLKTATKRLLKNLIDSELPRYHRYPDKNYLPYIHMKLLLALKSELVGNSNIVALFDEYRKMKDGLVKREQLNAIMMLLVRMVDAPKMGKHENLTLKRIPLLLDETSFERKKIEKRISEIEAKLSPFKKWRNKKGAHVDLESTVFQDSMNIYITMWGSYACYGEQPPPEDTVALALGNRYRDLKSHLDILNKYNWKNELDGEICDTLDAIKELEEYYDPVTGNRVVRMSIGNTYDEINETISEAIEMISDLLEYVAELCKARHGEVFIPVKIGDNDAQVSPTR